MGKSYQVSLVANTSQFKSAMADSARQMKTINSEFKSTTAETDKYGNALDKTGAKKKKLSATMQQYKMRITAIKNEQKHWTAELKKGNITEKEHAQKQQELSTRLNNTEASMKKTEGALKRLNQEGKKATRTYADFDRQFRDVGKSMRDIGMKVGITAGVGFLAMKRAITGVVTESMELEHQLAEVKAISGATGSEMETLKKQTTDLGGATKFTAQEVAEAQAGLARAGFEVNEITGAMPGLLNLAAAGNLDLAEASGITSNILRGFSIDATESGRVADVLAKGAATANTDVAGLGQAMEVVAPVAQSLGVEFESVAAATGIMADAGIDGSKSGRMLRQGMLRLAKPTGKSGKLIKELGINVFDADGNMKSMDKVVGELEKGLEGQTKQQEAAALSTIFGSESTAGWSVLLEKGSKDLGEYTGELENAEGAAEKMADTMEDSAQGKITKMESAISSLKIQLGDHLLPALGDGAEMVTNFIGKLGDMDESTQQTVAETALLVTAVLGVTTVLAGLVAAAGAFMAFAGPIGVAVAAGSLLFGGLAVAIHKSNLKAERANDVNLDLAQSLTDQANDLQASADSFDRLSEKAELSNKELALMNDLNIRISKSNNPEEIDKLQQQYNKLAEKSGLSKDEIEKLFKANADIIEQSPTTKQSISEQGNAFAENTVKVNEYIAALRKQSEIELEAQRVKMLKEEEEIRDRITEKTLDLEANEKRLLDLTKNSEMSKEEISARVSEINDKLSEGNLTERENFELDAERSDLLDIKKGKHSETIGILLEEADIIRESLDSEEEKLSKLELVNEQLANVKLSSVGINEEGREGIVVLEENLAKNNESLATLDSKLEKGKQLTEKEQEQYEELTKQNAEYERTHAYLTDELELYGSLNSLVESQKENLSEGTQERIKSLEKTHEIEVAEGNIVTQLQEKQAKYVEERDQLEENLEKQGLSRAEIDKQTQALDEKIRIGDEVLLQMLEELGLLELTKDGLLLNSQELEAYLETLGYSTEEAAELARILSEETIDGLNSKQDEAREAGKTKGDKHAEGVHSTKTSNKTTATQVTDSIVTELNKGAKKSSAGGKDKGDSHSTGLGSTLMSNILSGKSITQSIVEKLNEGKPESEGGGKGKGSAHNKGLSGTSNINRRSASNLSSTVSRLLGKTSDDGGGRKAGSDFNTGLYSTRGTVSSTASTLSQAISQRLGSTTDGGGGSKAGGLFSRGLSNKSGSANTAGATVSRSGERGLRSVSTSGAGSSFVSGFRNAISGGSVFGTAAALGRSALSGLKNAIRSRSPSKATEQEGDNFTDGFINSIGDGAKESITAANLLGKESVGALSDSVNKAKNQMGATAFTLDSNKEVFTVEHKLANDFDRLTRSLSEANEKDDDSRDEEVSLMKRQIDLLTELVLSNRNIEKKPVLTNREVTDAVNDKNALDSIGRFY